MRKNTGQTWLKDYKEYYRKRDLNNDNQTTRNSMANMKSTWHGKHILKPTW